MDSFPETGTSKSPFGESKTYFKKTNLKKKKKGFNKKNKCGGQKGSSATKIILFFFFYAHFFLRELSPEIPRGEQSSIFLKNKGRR